MKQELKEVLAAFAASILETYDLSFIPTDPKFLDATATAKRLGGAAVIYEYSMEVSVCRNKDSFIVYMPEEKEKHQQAKRMAEAAAILFFEMGYTANTEKFEKLKEMEKVTRKTGKDEASYEGICFLEHELMLPEYRLKDLIKKYADDKQCLRISDLSRELGFPYNFIEMRLIETGMIKSRWD